MSSEAARRFPAYHNFRPRPPFPIPWLFAFQLCHSCARPHKRVGSQANQTQYTCTRHNLHNLQKIQRDQEKVQAMIISPSPFPLLLTMEMASTPAKTPSRDQKVNKIEIKLDKPCTVIDNLCIEDGAIFTTEECSLPVCPCSIDGIEKSPVQTPMDTTVWPKSYLVLSIS